MIAICSKYRRNAERYAKRLGLKPKEYVVVTDERHCRGLTFNNVIYDEFIPDAEVIQMVKARIKKQENK